MIRRFGVTMVEVLAAIFIMGIGLIALLTLFPVGFYSMSQAIKDGRSAQACANASAIATLLNTSFRHDGTIGLMTTTDNPLTAAMLTGVPNGMNCPSYPVYCDPIGVLAGAGTKLGGVIPRAMPGFITSSKNQTQDTMQYFAVLDDLNFDPTGMPSLPTGNVQRQGTFSWAYLIKRPRALDDAVVNLTVVVYKGRGLQLSGSALAGMEQVVSATGTQNSNSITVKTGTPPVRRGDWVLDGSTSVAGEINSFGPVHSFFYRITEVVQGPSSCTLQTEFPLKANVTQIIVMSNVVEVFDKGPGWRQHSPQ